MSQPPYAYDGLKACYYHLSPRHPSPYEVVRYPHAIPEATALCKFYLLTLFSCMKQAATSANTRKTALAANTVVVATW